jgi:hypothetical protein
VFVSFKQASQGTYKASTADHYIKQLKHWVKTVLDCNPRPELYAGYSLRRGGVTETRSAGVPLSIIKAHVGWTPNSNAHCTYYDHNGQLQMRAPTRATGDTWQMRAPTRAMGAIWARTGSLA